MAYAFPSGTNTWIPSWEATGQTIAFIRDPKRFSINNYVDFRPATAPVGLYLEFDLAAGVRVQPVLASYTWHDGGERPSWEGNKNGFEFKSYRTVRHDNGFVLGNQAVDNAAWPILSYHSAATMQQSMTALSGEIIATLETEANWGTGNYDTCENVLDVAGGASAAYLDLANATPADANYMNIKKVFNNILIRLKKNTGSMVSLDDYWVVMSPNAAALLAQSAEIVDFIKQSPFAMMQIRGEIAGRNTFYGLPDQLYGWNICVEDTVQIAVNKGNATQTRAFQKNDDTLFFMSKPKALPGDQVGAVEGSVTPNFSTFQVFYYNEGNAADLARDGTASGLLTVETLPDIRNKRVEGHVVWQHDSVLVAPSSGFLLTDILS